VTMFSASFLSIFLFKFLQGLRRKPVEKALSSITRSNVLHNHHFCTISQMKKPRSVIASYRAFFSHACLFPVSKRGFLSGFSSNRCLTRVFAPFQDPTSFDQLKCVSSLFICKVLPQAFFPYGQANSVYYPHFIRRTA